MVDVLVVAVVPGRNESWRVGIASYWTLPSNRLAIVASTLLVSTVMVKR